MARSDLTDNLPTDVQVLQRELLRLRETLRATLQEKDRALRMLRSTNTDLYGRVQGQTRQLLALNRLINTINASLDLRQVMLTALSGLQSLLAVEVAALALRDSDGNIKYLMVQPASHMPTLAQLRLKPGQGIVGRVIALGQTYLDNEVAPASLTPFDTATGLTFRSVLCEPVMAHERVIGAVQLVNKWSGAFTDSDRAFMATVAGSVAVAIENARMYEEVQAQLKRLEHTHATLVETQAQLVQSAKLASIGQLAAGLAHEINNPIGIILGFAQLLSQRLGDERLRQYATTIEREAQRIHRIVSDLLGFARQAQAEATRLDLRQALDTAISLLEYQLTREAIEVVRDYAPEPAWVLANADQLQQVVMNLVQNARQAMPGGGRLTLRTWTEAGSHFFAVADTGLGIAEEVRQRIFDPFFTTKPVGQGTGLGLSVSYGIIRRHGGDIQVASQRGHGATFTVSLPKAE